VPALFPLFTEVRGIGILRTSPFGDSAKFVVTEFSEVRADTLAPWFACEGSNPFETSQARADTVGLPGVASGNCTPCGIRSIGNPDAASILPVQLKNEMSAVAS
jgi:hypothetical protein